MRFERTEKPPVHILLNILQHRLRAIKAVVLVGKIKQRAHQRRINVGRIQRQGFHAFAIHPSPRERRTHGWAASGLRRWREWRFSAWDLRTYSSCCSTMTSKTLSRA